MILTTKTTKRSEKNYRAAVNDKKRWQVHIFSLKCLRRFLKNELSVLSSFKKTTTNTTGLMQNDTQVLYPLCPSCLKKNLFRLAPDVVGSDG